ncbi:MAG: hypothetical protein BWY66_00820 [bacterium ADurb.Bin374]|nr:MAG: hypothetical protein BWY66_00820 [bacterium ADurb.Bin374]
MRYRIAIMLALLAINANAATLWLVPGARAFIRFCASRKNELYWYFSTSSRYIRAASSNLPVRS